MTIMGSILTLFLFWACGSARRSGRKTKISMDPNDVLSLRAEGRTMEKISAEMEVPPTTVSRCLSYLGHNEGTLTKYRELQHLRVSDLSAKVLDSSEADLPDMETDPRIKLLEVLIRSEAQFKERDKNGISLLQWVIDVHKEKEKEEAIEIENLNE